MASYIYIICLIPEDNGILDSWLKFYLGRTVFGAALISDFNSWIIINLPWQLETWSLGTKTRLGALMENAWRLTEWGYGSRIECPGWRLEPSNTNSEYCEVWFWVLREKHYSLGSHNFPLRNIRTPGTKKSNPNPRWMALAFSPGNYNNNEEPVPEDDSWPKASWRSLGNVTWPAPGYSGCGDDWQVWEFRFTSCYN